MDPGNSDHLYTMANEPVMPDVESNQSKGVPVSSQGLLSLIQAMNKQPLFQDKDYLFRNSHVTLRCPLTKDQCEEQEIPLIDMPWLEARVIQKLNHDNCFLLEVLGHRKEMVATTVANLEPGAAWMIKLDVIHHEGARSLHEERADHPLNDIESYPLVIFGEYNQNTVDLHGGLDSMPSNHLLDEIASLFPLPSGISTKKPVIIYAAMEEDQIPEIPRKSRKEMEDEPETVRPVLTPRRNPSRSRRSPDYLNKDDFIYDKPKHKIKQVLTSKEEDEHIIRDEQEPIVHVLMTQSNPDKFPPRSL